MNTKTLLCLAISISSAHAMTLRLGDTTGNTPGSGSLDVQSLRYSSLEAATGSEAVAVGIGNQASGDYSISVGYGNYVTGQECSGFGSGNEVDGNMNTAFGYSNIVQNPNANGTMPSAAFGGLNTLSASSDASYAFGYNNSINGSGSMAVGTGNFVNAGGATAFGSGITNSTPASTMIGPSNSAKITILSSGNLGIGTAAPAAKLEVSGSAKISGSLTVGGAAVLTAGADASSLTNLNANQLTSGTIPVARLPAEAVQTIAPQTLSNKTLSGTTLSGATLLNSGADVKVKHGAAIRVSAAGDVSMGMYTSGTNPDL